MLLPNSQKQKPSPSKFSTPAYDWAGVIPDSLQINNNRLSKEEERGLLEVYQSTGDEDVLKLLIEDNMWLAIHTVRRMRVPKYYTGSREDLLSVAHLGLIRGLQKFNLAMDNRISTFVGIYMWGFLLREFEKHDKHESPMRRSYATVRPHNETEGEQEEPWDRCFFDNAQEYEEHLLVKMDFERVMTLAEQLSSPRQWDIFRLRYGRGLTQVSVCRLLGISRQRVLQIENIVIDRVRDYIRRNDGSDDSGRCD